METEEILIMVTIAEQIILHSASDEQALQKAELLCSNSKKDTIMGSGWYYFKDESFILTKWNDYKEEYEIVEVMDGEE